MERSRDRLTEAGTLPLLEARGIMKEYDGETILAGCDLAVNSGDVVAVVGASGEGKSTLLSILGLLLTPSAGQVLVEGQETSGWNDRDLSALRARSFGFLFQHTQLIGSLRAIDNVLVPACFGGADMGKAAVRAEDLTAHFGLLNRVNHYPHQLSVGQKRRVALARALVLAPRLVIADEPTNDLDEVTAGAVVDSLLGFADASHAVLCATHDLDLARRAGRVLRLADGRLTEIAPEDVKEVGRAC